MEYALRVEINNKNLDNTQGLNPCSNGICSSRDLFVEPRQRVRKGLNPCSNGICSSRIGGLPHSGVS